MIILFIRICIIPILNIGNQIVKLGKYVEEKYRYKYTIFSQIFHYEIFLSHLNGVEYFENWGALCQMDIQYIVIKIDYSDGDLIYFT